MSLFRLYARVLSLLGNDRRLAVGLGVANVALAVAAFAEPLIMGRIIDGLTHLKRGGSGLQTMLPLIGAWVAFGFFTIAAGVAIALHADRLAHRRRLATMAIYFEHVLDLPLAFHSANHSGRAAQGRCWRARTACRRCGSSFFRDHCAALVALGVLLPLTLLLNWRLGASCWSLVAGLRRADRLRPAPDRGAAGQRRVATSTVSPSMPPTRSATSPVIQSFTRVEAETRAMREHHRPPAARADPGPVVVGAGHVATRASATLTILRSSCSASCSTFMPGDARRDRRLHELRHRC